MNGYPAGPRPLVPAAVALVLAFTVATAVPAQSPPVAPGPAVSADALMATLRTLSSKEFEGRGAGTPGGAKARAWVRERFGDIGLTPASDTFEHPFSFRPRGRAQDGAELPAVHAVNLIGTCPGTEPSLPVMVLSAHYDHVGVRGGEIFHGADDNASGVAVLLEAAAHCVRQPFRRTVIVVAFDAEEMGLQGARAFLAAPPVAKDRIALNVNLDMVARGDKGELYAAGLHHSPTLGPLLEPVAARAPIRLLFGHDTPGSGHDDWTLQSDHGVFHEAGIPFVYFGVEDHADYHRPTDTADKVNPDFFAKAAATVLDALRALDAGLK
ncbi:MAG: M20/M25/M40 family metallo-hydrolase [Vicinamibacterales bacterium]